jgi:hypothetical protein
MMITERIRRRRAVVADVTARKGDLSVDEVAAELARAYAEAGIPQTNERLASDAAFVVNGRVASVVAAAGSIATVLRTKEAPPGLRREKRRLTGDRWVAVELLDDPVVQADLEGRTQVDAKIRRMAADPRINMDPDPLGPTVRLTVIDRHATPRLVAFLEDSFVGTLPPADRDSADLWRAIADAEGDDLRLVVRARVEKSDETYALLVALP